MYRADTNQNRVEHKYNICLCTTQSGLSLKLSTVRPFHVNKNNRRKMEEVHCPGNGMNDLLFGYVWFNVSWYTCRSLVTALRLSWPRNCEVQVPYRQVLLDSGRDAWHEPRSLPIIGFFAEFFNNHRPNRNNSRAPAWRAFSVNGPVFGHRGVDSRHRRGGWSGKELKEMKQNKPSIVICIRGGYDVPSAWRVISTSI
jgi:hypothetical protein